MGRAIATRYGSSTEQKQQLFGRVDWFCGFAVVPLLIVAGLFFWSEIPMLGVVLVVLSILIVVIDSWANRPPRPSTDRSREDA